MMYKYANNILPPVINDMMYIITIQDRSTFYMSIRVISISTQKALLTQVLAYGMLYSPKLRKMIRYLNTKFLQKCICKNIHFISYIQNRTIIICIMY